MKSIRFTLAAFALSNALLCFAGGQPARYYTPGKTGAQPLVRTIYSVDSRTRVVRSAVERSGKNGEQPVNQEKPVPVRTIWQDSAFRK